MQLNLCNLDVVKKEPENVHVKNEPVVKNEPMHLVQRAFDFTFNLNDDDDDQ